MSLGNTIHAEEPLISVRESTLSKHKNRHILQTALKINISSSAVRRLLRSTIIWFQNWQTSIQLVSQSELVGDVAVLFCAFGVLTRYKDCIGADLPPPSSARYVFGRPGRRLHFLGVGDLQACRAREWSWNLSARATWPNNLGVWSARCLIAVAVQYAYGHRNLLHAPTR